MDSTLRLTSSISAFGDGLGVSNPEQTHLAWGYRASDLPVRNPVQQPMTVPAGQTVTVFDGTRALSTDGTTDFDLELLNGYSDRYRLRWTGGTDPVFRTNRNLDLDGDTVVVTINGNGTATFSCAANPFGAVVAGDVLWIPEDDEVASQPFAEGNWGVWTVLAASAGSVVATREGTFSAANESAVTITDADEIQAFSAAGVQVGDSLEILAGFVASTRRTFPIVEVTPGYLDFTSTLALAPETAVSPGAAGLAVYSASKRFLRVETDQEAVVRVNGDSSSVQRITPWTAADPKGTGYYERVGATWKLVVVNLSPSPMSLVAISCE